MPPADFSLPCEALLLSGASYDATYTPDSSWRQVFVTVAD